MWFKASETLLGIETPHYAPLWWGLSIQSLWNPFRDWNLRLTIAFYLKDFSWFKASETLLGIETPPWGVREQVKSLIQSLWNPFRDWN